MFKQRMNSRNQYSLLIGIFYIIVVNVISFNITKHNTIKLRRICVFVRVRCKFRLANPINDKPRFEVSDMQANTMVAIK